MLQLWGRHPSYAYKPGLVPARPGRLPGCRVPQQQRVAEFLRVKGESLNSSVLLVLAVRVADDAFARIE